MPMQRALRRWINLPARETPSVAMQPAGSLLAVLVRAKRLYACAPVLSEGLRETITNFGVAGAGKFVEPHWT